MNLLSDGNSPAASWDIVFNNESTKTFNIYDQKAELVTVSMKSIVNNTNALTLNLNTKDVQFKADNPAKIVFLSSLYQVQ